MARQDGELRAANRLAYQGSKLRFADQLVAMMPTDCDTFVEPFAGMAIMSQVATVIPQWRRIVVGDLAPENVNLFRTIRDDAEALAAKLRLPISDSIYDFCAKHHLDPDASPTERAWRYLVKLNNSEYASPHRMVKSGFAPTLRFNDMAEHLPLLSTAFQRIEIHQVAALDLIAENDGPTTFHFCDPPYVDSTRKRSEWWYPVEMTDADHEEFCDRMNEVKGKALVCGYPSEIYSRKLKDWNVSTLDYFKHDNETVWRNFG